MTKDKIYKAVVKTFSEEGVEGLTMKMVAEYAGIGKSTVYEYFESKEKMIAETIIFSANKFIDDFYDKAWNQSSVAFEETLKSSIAYFIEAMKHDFGDFIAFAMESSNGRFKQYMKKEMSKDMMVLAEKAINYSKKLFDKGIKEGYIKSDYDTLDVLNFQRLLFVFCSNFTSKSPFIQMMVAHIDDPVAYVYDHLVKLYRP